MESILVEMPAASIAILCHCDIFVVIRKILLLDAVRPLGGRV
jgi:hypothetical protein